MAWPFALGAAWLVAAALSQAATEPWAASLAVVLRPEPAVSLYVTGTPAAYIAPFDAMYAVDRLGFLDDISIKA